MATILDWVKSLRADICGDSGRGLILRGRDVGVKIVMQIDRNDENGRIKLLFLLVGEKNYHVIDISKMKIYLNLVMKNQLIFDMNK